MQRHLLRRAASVLPAVIALAAIMLPGALRDVAAQDMEPRRWTHLPVDVNVLGVAYVYTTGDLYFDPVLRIEDAEVEMSTAAVSYNRTFALLGRTARLDVRLPVQHGRWDGLVDGESRSVTREGLADPRIRLSVLLAGAPALRGEAFREYRKDRPASTVLGAALALRLPWGEYMDDKLINLGGNRLVVEPQLGVLHTVGPWSFELTGSAYLYDDNDDFFNGNELEQDPLFAVQAHVVRTLAPGWWISAGAAYGWDGESTINGEAADDARSNLLYGLAFGFPLGATRSMQLGYIRREALQDVGMDGHNVFVSWSIRF
ncbi:MAG: transporter [Planctomycetota bacterium]